MLSTASTDPVLVAHRNLWPHRTLSVLSLYPPVWPLPSNHEVVPETCHKYVTSSSGGLLPRFLLLSGVS